MCFFHENKKAKWKVEDSKSEFDSEKFCSKCAMKIA